jgi:hypothetical protein
MSETVPQIAGRLAAEDICEDADDMGTVARFEFMESVMKTIRENYCTTCWGTTLPCQCRE